MWWKLENFQNSFFNKHLWNKFIFSIILCKLIDSWHFYITWVISPGLSKKLSTLNKTSSKYTILNCYCSSMVITTPSMSLLKYQGWELSTSQIETHVWQLKFPESTSYMRDMFVKRWDACNTCRRTLVWRDTYPTLLELWSEFSLNILLELSLEHTLCQLSFFWDRHTVGPNLSFNSPRKVEADIWSCGAR